MKPPIGARLKADAGLLLAALIWGTAFVPQRMIGQQGSVHFFNGARFLLAAGLLWALVLRFRMPREAAFWRLAALAGLFLFAGSALQQAGLQTTTAGNAGFITSLYTIFVPLLLFLFWRERISGVVLAALALALGGAYLLSTGGGAFHPRPGDWLEIAGALFWAGHVVLIGRFASRYAPIAFAVGQFFVTGLLSLAAGLLTEWPFAPDPGLFAFTVLYTGVFSVAIAYTLQVWGQRYAPPTDAALILSLESVFAALSGWLVLGELLNGAQAVGCVLIFGGVMLSQADVFWHHWKERIP